LELTDRLATYDFPLVIHSNHGLPRTVSEINGNFGPTAISVENRKFFPPRCI